MKSDIEREARVCESLNVNQNTGGHRMGEVYEKLLKCYECYKSRIDFQPDVAVVLGSGLGNFARTVDVKAELPYSEIEGFPVSTVPGHAGKGVP